MADQSYFANVKVYGTRNHQPLIGALVGSLLGAVLFYFTHPGEPFAFIFGAFLGVIFGGFVVLVFSRTYDLRTLVVPKVKIAVVYETSALMKETRVRACDFLPSPDRYNWADPYVEARHHPVLLSHHVPQEVLHEILALREGGDESNKRKSITAERSRNEIQLTAGEMYFEPGLTGAIQPHSSTDILKSIGETDLLLLAYAAKLCADWDFVVILTSNSGFARETFCLRQGGKAVYACEFPFGSVESKHFLDEVLSKAFDNYCNIRTPIYLNANHVTDEFFILR